MRLKLTAAMVVALALACQDSPQPIEPNARAAALAAQDANLPLTAEVEFGSDAVGTEFPPGSHDRSFHAFDKLRPATVVIQRGGRRARHARLAWLQGHRCRLVERLLRRVWRSGRLR